MDPACRDQQCLSIVCQDKTCPVAAQVGRPCPWIEAGGAFPGAGELC
ncbi:hypothetical protein [Brachybacterium sacelli]